MKRVLFLFQAALLVACAGSPDPEKAAYALAEEVERLAGQRSLWPGFEPMTIPLAIYDGEMTYLFRHPAPPEGFVATQHAERGVYAFEGRHPSVTANSNAEIGKIPTATLVLEGVDLDKNLTDLAAVALHEAFHVYERERHPSWQGNEVDLFVYPTDDAGLLGLRRLETQALRRALEASDVTMSACWARCALALRGERFSVMDAIFAAYERGTELNEGLATYVELRAKGRDGGDVEEGGFEATDIRDRTYFTGSAFALLLDRFHADWPKTFESDDTQSLDSALQAALTAHEPASVPCTFSDAEIAEAERIAGDDVAAVRARQHEQKIAFDNRQGWRVVVEAADGQPLWPEGFDPLNVDRVEGGILHGRFLRVGNNAGYLEAIDGGETDIEALTEGVGPHPIFNGIRRAEIAGVKKPDIDHQTDRVILTTPGLEASFMNARVEEIPETFTVRLTLSQ